MVSQIYKWHTMPPLTWSHWLFVVWYHQQSSIESEHPYLLCHSIPVKLQRHWLRLSVCLLNIGLTFPSWSKCFRVQFLPHYIIDTIDEKKIKKYSHITTFYLMEIFNESSHQSNKEGNISSNNGYKTKSDQFKVHTLWIILVWIYSYYLIEI